jgi:hypothetical protein
MHPTPSEIKMKPGVCYAFSNDGIELPVIDITHPAFKITLDETELSGLQQQFLGEQKRLEKTPGFLRSLLYAFMSRRSVIMSGLMGASGTFMSGMNTYLMKLGPDNLDEAHFSAIDRQIAASPAGVFMRLRLQETAGLLAYALLAPLNARPGASLHLLNIGGGPAVDSLNALILVRSDHPDLLAGRHIYVHSLDMDRSGPEFGAHALASLLAGGAPLSGLQIEFIHTGYDWSNPEALHSLVGSFEDERGIVGVSSEGALFEYGCDEDITGNLQVLHETTPSDTVVAGSVTRADDIGRTLNGRSIGSRAALQLRGLEAFTVLARSAGWTVAERIDRPLSHIVRLEKR